MGMQAAIMPTVSSRLSCERSRQQRRHEPWVRRMSDLKYTYKPQMYRSSPFPSELLLDKVDVEA